MLGKFDNNSYKTSGGLHGVGISVVNALSEYLSVEVVRDKSLYRQDFARGKPTTKLENKGKPKRKTNYNSFQARQRDIRGWT